MRRKCPSPELRLRWVPQVEYVQLCIHYTSAQSYSSSLMEHMRLKIYRTDMFTK